MMSNMQLIRLGIVLAYLVVGFLFFKEIPKRQGIIKNIHSLFVLMKQQKTRNDQEYSHMCPHALGHSLLRDSQVFMHFMWPP